MLGDKFCPAQLSGTNGDAFLLSPYSPLEGGKYFFTITPKAGLTVGTYEARVTVADVNGVSSSFRVVFRVKEEAPLPPTPPVVPVTERLSFSLPMTLDESRIFEALVSPGESEAEWYVTDYPLSPDYPRVVKLEKIEPGDLAGRSAARNQTFAQEPFAQEPVIARMVSVTATALGTAEIEVRTPGGDLFAKCLVTVEPAEEPEIIVVRQGGGCRGQTAPGLITGLAVLALVLAAKKAGATRTDAQRASLRKTPAGHS